MEDEGLGLIMENFFEKIDRCYIVAEIGVNHNGDMKTAKELINAAKKCGANAVKFQTFKAEKLVTKTAPKVKYQLKKNCEEETHYEMLKRLELSEKNQIIIQDYCKKKNIDFISTPYDIDSAKFLHEKLNVAVFKTASADVVDLPLQRYIASTGKPVMVAVGMATLGEIEQVCEIYRKEKNSNLILLHCVSNYPCSDQSINLKVMQTLKDAFHLPVGYSDHSEGTMAATLSISLGAKVIEKHFTLRKYDEGPDHKASDTPEQFRELVTNVRRAELILGDSVKRRQEEENQMAQVSRKSIHVKKTVRKGEKIAAEHLILKRPGTGIMPAEINRVIGRIARISMHKDYQISYMDLE